MVNLEEDCMSINSMFKGGVYHNDNIIHNYISNKEKVLFSG